MKLVIEISPEAIEDVRQKEKFEYLGDEFFQKLIELTLQSKLSEKIKVRKALI